MIITFRYLDMNEVAEFALTTLRDLSPVGTGSDQHPGLYRDSHTLFLNGASVLDARNWKPGDQLEISNPEPYANKIEIGKMKISVAGHVYERATKIVSDRYPNVDAKFQFMPLRFADAKARSAAGISSRHSRIKSARQKSGDWLSRQPAMILKGR